MHPDLYILGIIISLTILVVGVWNYRRKTGVDVRGSFSVASSQSCEDQYVAQITLENQKDRVVTLFGIYLQIGHAYHIKIEDFDDSPYLLKPYETLHKKYGPIEFYAVSTKKVDFNELLSNDKVRKRLVLSTSLGKYTIRKHVHRWNPIVDLFKNNMAATVTPVRSTYKEKALGSNVKYIVEIIIDDGHEEIIPIHPRDYELQVFRSFGLTPESLENKEALERYLGSKKMSGILTCEKVLVHDVDAWRARANDFYRGPKIKAKNYRAFTFYVIGRLYTWYSVWKLKHKNKKARQAANKSQ